MFKVPEKFRITTAEHKLLGTNHGYGNNGAFRIPMPRKRTAYIIASDGDGWDHVSAHIYFGGLDFTPSWNEMHEIKLLFWDHNDTVYQFHPPQKDYINMHPFTLHLWRPQFTIIPLPPPEMVGIT